MNIFPSEQEKSAMYEAIGRAVASYSMLEHVAIELALVWDESRENYGRSLAAAGKYALRHLAGDPSRQKIVRDVLECAGDLTETRNAIVHGVWSETYLDDELRFFAVRTLPAHATRTLENPEHLFGKAMSTAQLKDFAVKCEGKTRLLGEVRDSLHAETSGADL